MQPQCPKLRNQCIAAVREDNSEEIVKAIKKTLERDARDNVSEEKEIPLKEKKISMKVQMKKYTHGMRSSTK